MNTYKLVDMMLRILDAPEEAGFDTLLRELAVDTEAAEILSAIVYRLLDRVESAKGEVVERDATLAALQRDMHERVAQKVREVEAARRVIQVRGAVYHALPIIKSEPGVLFVGEG